MKFARDIQERCIKDNI